MTPAAERVDRLVVAIADTIKRHGDVSDGENFADAMSALVVVTAAVVMTAATRDEDLMSGVHLVANQLATILSTDDGTIAAIFKRTH